MAREIRVKIDYLGRIKIDFSGYEGTECLGEADSFWKAVEQFGIDLSQGVIKAKSELSSIEAKYPKAQRGTIAVIEEET